MIIPSVIKIENISVSLSIDKVTFKAFTMLRTEAMKNTKKLKKIGFLMTWSK